MNSEGEKEAELIRRMALWNDEDAFRSLFYDFFSPLCVFARRYLESIDKSTGLKRVKFLNCL